MNEWNPEANEIFAMAATISDHSERCRMLDERCGTNKSLRRAVESLLVAHDRDPDFLDEGLVQIDKATISSRRDAGVGAQIGPFKLLQEIGEGGFGVVYMAEQKQPVRRKVALKVIKAGMDTREVIARFEAERQALAMMDHPNIAKVLDAGTTESGRPYFVMELVRGVSITEFCDKNQANTRDRLQLFAGVCRAVQHAHLKGIIHRDLKPSNVMVTLNDGQPLVKVIDFGVAKAINQELTEKTLFTSYGQMVGTPQYMSPEQAEMSAIDIDTRSDVYSLGVLLYELLTGTTPLSANELRGAGYAELQKQIVSKEAPRPSARLSTLGEELSIVATNRKSDPSALLRVLQGELDWIVMTALEKDRNRRYETASAFATDIERYMANETVQACPPSVTYRVRKYIRRNRLALATAALVVASLVVGIVGTSWMALEAAKQEQLAADRAAEADRQRQVAVKALERFQEELRWKATTLAMNGMSQELEDVISEVEIKSVPNNGWVQRVRAIAALADDDPQTAVELLHDAINLGDKTVAAFSLMVRALWAGGDDRREPDRRTSSPSQPYSKLAGSLEPKTLEDELFLAGIIFVRDPKRAFDLADSVYKEHPSPEVLEIRATASEHLGLVTRDPAWLERAIRDSHSASYAKGQSPAFSIYCHAWAIELAKARGDQANADYHTLVGKRLISEIGTISTGVPAFHVACGDLEQAEAAYRSLALKSDFFKRHYAAFLLSHGDDAGVTQVINSMDNPDDNNLARLYRAVVLSESSATRSESREILLAELRRGDMAAEPSPVRCIGWLHALGFRRDAIREAKRIAELLRSTPGDASKTPTLVGYNSVPDPVALDFLAHLADEKALLASAGDNHKMRAGYYGLIAQRHLGNGDIAAAKQMIADWDGLHLTSFASLILIRMRTLMERDPEWPHWLSGNVESQATPSDL